MMSLGGAYEREFVFAADTAVIAAKGSFTLAAAMICYYAIRAYCEKSKILK